MKICPKCGGLCNAKEQVKAANQKAAAFQQASEKGFGFGDFGNAISYPFRFKFSLVFGAVMYMFFSLGRGASALGGIFMIAASIICLMLANMLTFGILAHTTEEFSQGKIGGDFMPRFDEFSLWDDVVHPFFLSLGAYISSFGAFFLIVAIGGYMVFNAVASQHENTVSQVEKLPGTPVYTGIEPVQQSKKVEDLINKVKKQNEERQQRIADLERGAETGDAPENLDVNPKSQSDPNEELRQAADSANRSVPATTRPADDDGAEQAQKMIDQMRKQQLESALGKSPETKAKEQSEFISRFLTYSAPIVVLSAIAFLWGLFYFPAACAVAGYTRSFTAAINPLVGLDTIKRLGFSYVKLLFMGFLLVVAFILIGMMLTLVFLPFDLPGMGNIPVKIIGGFIEFYFWIVFCCLIGFLLFKSSDKLKLYR